MGGQQGTMIVLIKSEVSALPHGTLLYMLYPRVHKL
jgi:hypothetical protein